MRVLVTGTAGFIGYHVAERLLARGDHVVGFDVVNDYYDVRLKEARLDRLARHAHYRHVRADLADAAAVLEAAAGAERVIHLAAQAGVRYSLTNPVRTSRATWSASPTSSKPAASTACST